MARDPDINEPAEPVADRPVCPECGHVNVQGAGFCARCGHSLNDDGPVDDVIDVSPSDSQATSTFQPVTSTVSSPSSSPWARPGSVDADPGQTSALPMPDPATRMVDAAPLVFTPERRGPRGFLLGVLALLLILAVLAVYVYVAWLDDSARASVDGWLPWM